MRYIFVISLFSFLFYFFGPISPVLAVDMPDDQLSPELIFTEIRIGGPSLQTNKEYVTIFNQSSSAIDLSARGFRLDYAKSTFDMANCGLSDWPTTGSSANSILLSGNILPAMVLTFEKPMNDSDGSIRLIDDAGMVHDRVGWGLSAKCFETAPTTTPSTSSTNPQSLVRYLDCESGLPIDTNNNLLDFGLTSQPDPGALNGIMKEDCTDPTPPEEDPDDGSGRQTQNSCAGLKISELLVNPAGSDISNEFIELYNPTSNLILFDGCSLQTSANSKVYGFGDQQIKAGEYIAFYSVETGLTLTNSSGGSVWLIDGDDSEVDQADYPANLEDDVSWSLVGSNFKPSFILTPNQSNIEQDTKPCPAGQYRNEQTNRCNNIEVQVLLADCGIGKERNPDTGRCRNITSLASVLKPCSSDQYRNPETNRCRNLVTSSASKPCEQGQERNPETNRCRNVPSVLSDQDENIKDIISPAKPNNSWPLAIFSFFAAGAYALFEYRNEIFLYLLSIRQKLAST